MVLTGFLLLILLASEAPGQITLRTQDHYERGMSAYQSGDYPTAIRELSTFLDQDGAESDAVTAGAALGLAYFFQASYQKALPLLEEAGNRAPDNDEVAYGLAMCHLRLGQSEGSRRAFSRLFGVPPDSAEAHLLAAKFMIAENLWELVQQELQTAQKKAPHAPKLHYLLGLVSLNHGEWEQAASEFEDEIKLDPSNSMAYYQLGRAYAELQLSDRAIAVSQKSVWLNPYFTGPYLVLGSLYHKNGQLPMAEGLLKQALSMDPNNSAGRYLLASVYRDMGRKEDAATQLDLARQLKKRPDSELGTN